MMYQMRDAAKAVPGGTSIVLNEQVSKAVGDQLSKYLYQEIRERTHVKLKENRRN